VQAYLRDRIGLAVRQATSAHIFAKGSQAAGTTR
jgi:hypothetical protein